MHKCIWFNSHYQPAGSNMLALANTCKSRIHISSMQTFSPLCTHVVQTGTMPQLHIKTLWLLPKTAIKSVAQFQVSHQIIVFNYAKQLTIVLLPKPRIGLPNTRGELVYSYLSGLFSILTAHRFISSQTAVRGVHWALDSDTY